MGNWLSEVDGALWSFEMLNMARNIPIIGDYVRVVVAVDPAVTAKANSSETGIMVGAVGTSGKFLVIEDASGIYTPNEWANKVINLYYKYSADCVVGEVNNGGDLIETNVTSIDKNINFTQVRATRGKIKRAEPVSALYEQGRVFHLKRFSELEEQMTSFTGVDGDKSPDRLDALVWLLTELMTDNNIAGIREM